MGSRFFRSECGMTRSTEPACAFARRPSIVAPGGSANVEAEAARNWRLVQRMFSPLCCGFSCFDLTSLNGCTAFQLSGLARNGRSEEHTSELQSLMRISYAVFCLKKKNNATH